MTTTPVEQSTDSIWNAGNAIDFVADSEVLTIDANVIVGSQNGSGVDQTSAYSGGHVVNNGNIFSQGDSYAGVYMRAGTDTVTNNAGAFIQGYDGVNFFGLSVEKLVNAGSITGSSVGVEFSGGDVSQIVANNTGVIYGEIGLFVAATSTEVPSTIHNSGIIDGGTEFGVYVNQGASSKTTILNQAGGLIEGKVDAIIVESGTLVLTNNGTLSGEFADAGGTKDVITNNGWMDDFASLSDHSDTFNGAASKSSVTVFGNKGSDHLTGGSHADTLDGGGGDDTLTGGGGKDRFNFDTTLSSKNIDTITDFTPGTDKIELGSSAFHGLNASGALQANMFSGNGTENSHTRIVYDPTTGHLSYDSNGSGAGHLVQFATLAENLTLHNTDFMILGF